MAEAGTFPWAACGILTPSGFRTSSPATISCGCAHYELRPFDEDFYAPDNAGVIVERTEPNDPAVPAITLAQARGEEPVVLQPGLGFIPAP